MKKGDTIYHLTSRERGSWVLGTVIRIETFEERTQRKRLHRDENKTNKLGKRWVSLRRRVHVQWHQGNLSWHDREDLAVLNANIAEVCDYHVIEINENLAGRLLAT